MNILINVFIFGLLITLVRPKSRSAFVLNENWVCNVKRSCLECLRLSQCSWCEEERRCFSRKLNHFELFCKDNSTEYQDHGLNFIENARCSCAGGRLEEKCVPEGETSGLKCSGRGECLCGRCVCSVPDEQHPTKVVLGQYCEYDNFSCDGPRCNEGPYHLQTDSLVQPDSVPSE